MKKIIVILTAPIILLMSCGAPETAAETTTPAATTAGIFEMTTAAEISSETAKTSEATTTYETITAPPVKTTAVTTVTERDIRNDHNRLMEDLINKSEYKWGMGLNDVSYNYLIQNIDISDYEVIDVSYKIPNSTNQRQYKIRVNVTRSDAPHFPVGERIWIIEDDTYGYIDLLYDSESDLSYLRYTYIDEKTYNLSIAVAVYFSLSFNCYETTSVDEYLKTILANEKPLYNYGISPVYGTGVFAWAMKNDVPEPLPPTPSELELYDIFPADYLNAVFNYSLVTDVDMNDYCKQAEGKIWTFWESSGEYGSYEITDDYIEITYYADWSHIVPAKTVRYFFDDSEFPRLERLELAHDFGYVPCVNNPYI
jgi:hypothetical protein